MYHLCKLHWCVYVSNVCMNFKKHTTSFPGTFHFKMQKYPLWCKLHIWCETCESCNSHFLASVINEVVACSLFEVHCLSNSGVTTSLSLFKHNFLSPPRNERFEHYEGVSSLALCCTLYFQLIKGQIKEDESHTTLANKLTPVWLKLIQVHLQTSWIIAAVKASLNRLYCSFLCSVQVSHTNLIITFVMPFKTRY